MLRLGQAHGLGHLCYPTSRLRYPTRHVRPRLDVLDTPNGRALDFLPVDAVVELFVDESHGADVVAPHNVQAQGDLGRRFEIVGRADDALQRVGQDLGRWGLASVFLACSRDESRASAPGGTRAGADGELTRLVWLS